MGIRVIRRASWRSALVVFVAVEGRPIGALLSADELRAETPHAIRMLRAARITRIVMVTGDTPPPRKPSAPRSTSMLCSPTACLRTRSMPCAASSGFPDRHGRRGINDAPALAAANVGIAMGAHGASASSEAADVVIIADRLDRVAEALAIAQRARRIALESIVVGISFPSSRWWRRCSAGYRAGAGGADSGTDRRRRHPQRLAGAEPGLAAALADLPPPPASNCGTITSRWSVLIAADIADALDDASPESAVGLIDEANTIVQRQVVAHERDDEGNVYPRSRGPCRTSPGCPP